MTSYGPPTEDVPIFDTLYFKQGEDYLTQNQADKRYLRYPNAQGTENLSTIVVNGTASFQANISTSGGLNYDNNTNILSSTTLDGNIVLDEVFSSGPWYPVLASGDGSRRLAVNIPPISMTYNAATNTLTATTFSGNATTATTAVTATNANNVYITSDDNSGTFYIPFTKTSGNGNKALFQDDTTGPLTYNPSTATLTYNKWNVGVPFIFDDFTTIETNGPIGWFNSVNTGTTQRLIFEGSTISADYTALNVQLRAGLFFIQTSTSGAEVIYTSGIKCWRPCSTSRIDWGIIDLETGTLATAPVTPTSTSVVKTFGLSDTTTSTGGNDSQNGIFFRVNVTGQTDWELIINNSNVASVGKVIDSNIWRFSLVFTNNGANVSAEVWNGQSGSTNTFGPFAVSTPTAPYFLYNHLKSTNAVTRGIMIDYIKFESNSQPINRIGSNAVTR